MPINECVRCGACCKKGPCQFGAWDWDRTKCKFLTPDNECSVYDKIKDAPGANYAPAFGQGCCMPTGNEDRNRKLAEGAN